MIKNFCISFLFLMFCTASVFSQIEDFKEKFELPTEVEETSGLLFLDDKIITHNDSGDAANLYEIDSLSGNILRTVNINNATHVDWEDITQDENHIYIGDFGNNNGTRTDLKIYKILKTDFKKNTSVSAEVISFSYEDQTDFTSSTTHNFDAEAFVVYQNSLLIFTKNRGDLKTNVYKIPTTIGSHSATKISSADVSGLITGATYNLSDDSFFLCGYSTQLDPFLIYISGSTISGDNIFSSGFTKYDIDDELEQGSQVEGIVNFGESKYYLSRERFSTTVSGFTFTFPQKLYEFTDANLSSLSIANNSLETLNISPNPTSDKVFIKTDKNISKVLIFNTLGKKVYEINSDQKEINFSAFTKGIYLLKITLKNQNIINRKIIKL